MGMLFKPRIHLTNLGEMALHEHDIPTSNLSDQFGSNGLE
jgi:hypothetical protein